MKQKPATASYYDKQEDWPTPAICFGPSSFYNQPAGQTVDKKEYDQGGWSSGQLNLTERELFDLLTPDLSHLTPLVKIQKFLHEKSGGKTKLTCEESSSSLLPGDAYEDIEVNMRNMTEVFEKGLEVVRCDYYYIPKCYCLTLR